MHHSTSLMDNNLCLRCKQFNIPDAFSTGWASTGFYGRSITIHQEPSGNIEGLFSSCPFCNLIKTVLPLDRYLSLNRCKPSDRQMLQEKLARKIDDIAQSRVAELDTLKEPIAHNEDGWTVTSGLEEEYLVLNEERHQGWSIRLYSSDHYSAHSDLHQRARTNSNLSINLVAPSSRTIARRCVQISHKENCDDDTFFGALTYGRAVEEQGANFDLLRSWFTLCRNHGEDCEPTPTTKAHESLRLIDVRKRCIKTCLRYPVYAALSYVWGTGKRFELTSENLASFQKQGAFLDDDTTIPLVIRDAMMATEKLGLNYLWVDAVCIIQNDDKDKRQQVAQMDTTYNAAAITFVAAAGSDANFGLPGVRPGSRPVKFPRITAKIEDLYLISLQGSSSSRIPDSTWATRGWTFQEKVLSKRLLYFTESQAFYQCAKSQYREDTILENEDSTTRVVAPFLRTYSPSSYDSPWLMFKELVEDYNFRGLTFEDDILDAFQGVINWISTSMGQFHFGLPLNEFTKGLLWNIHQTDSSDPHRRRQKFPSWSWAGWRRAKMNKLLNGHRSPGNAATWTLDIEKQNIQPCVVFTHVGPLKHSLNGVAVKAEALCTLDGLTRVDLQQWLIRDHGVRDENWVHPTRIQDTRLPQGNMLCFITSLAYLGLEREDRFGGPNADYFNIISFEKNKRIGSIWLGHEVIKRHGTSLDFIAIARATGRYTDSGKEYKGFYLMAIEWKHGYAERIEITQVLVKDEDWWGCKPEWRIINLA